MSTARKAPMTATESLYSKPAVRRGDVYCAPWCGGRCTHKAFLLATKEASALAARMGDGWKPEVWENLGWHYKVTRGLAEVTVNIKGDSIGGRWVVTGYTGWLQTSPQYIANADTPEDALGFAVQDARGAVAKINLACDALLA